MSGFMGGSSSVKSFIAPSPIVPPDLKVNQAIHTNLAKKGIIPESMAQMHNGPIEAVESKQAEIDPLERRRQSGIKNDSLLS